MKFPSDPWGENGEPASGVEVNTEVSRLQAATTPTPRTAKFPPDGVGSSLRSASRGEVEVEVHVDVPAFHAVYSVSP